MSLQKNETRADEEFNFRRAFYRSADIFALFKIFIRKKADKEYRRLFLRDKSRKTIKLFPFVLRLLF